MNLAFLSGQVPAIRESGVGDGFSGRNQMLIGRWPMGSAHSWSAVVAHGRRGQVGKSMDDERERGTGMYTFLCASLAGMIAFSAQAGTEVTESDFFDEMPVVLSVSRLSQPVNEAPAAVTVIDQDMIRASGFRDIPDLLRLVPGFSVAYTRDNTWAVGYHGMADAYSRRFQVLVDGRSLYSPHFGAVHWGDLPLSVDDIERIEVVRGPNAASYGSNAFFAVINILTKDATQTAGEFASLQYGEQGMGGVTLRHGGGQGGLRYRLTASAQNRDRFETDTRTGNGTVEALYEKTDTYFVNGRLDYLLSGADELTAQFGLSNGDWHAGRLRSAFEPRTQDTSAFYAQVKYRHVQSADDEWMLHFYHSRNRFDADAAVVIPVPFAPGFDTVSADQYLLQTRTNLEFQANRKLADTLRMVWGAEVRHESVKSPLNYNTSATLDGFLGRVHANLEWRATPAVLVQGGALLEHHYFTGLDLSPRVAINYTLTPGHTLRASVSQAYRAPTFFEQDGNLTYYTSSKVAVDVVTLPAAGSLESEKIVSRELAYLAQITPLNMQLDARIFYDTLTHYLGNERVTPLPAPFVELDPRNRAFRVLNGGALQVRGAEAQLQWQPVAGLHLSAQYARVVIDASDDIVDDDLPESAPLNNYSLIGRYAFAHGWHFSAGLYRSDDMKWLSDGDFTKGFTRVDARLARRWKWSGHEVEAALIGQNLGQDYSEFRVENHFSQRVYASFSLSW